MFVKKLLIKNFRNHSYSTFEFSPHLNVITGENASGKTNIVEAIYYLSLARSFRGVEDNELLKHGKDVSEIKAVVQEGNIIREIAIILQKEARHVAINGKPVKRISDLTKCVNIALFEPKDVMLFKGSPRDRRLFLDVSISKKTPIYLEQMSRYEKVLKERNEILKADKPDLVLLKTTTEMLAKLVGPIIAYRELYVKDINDILYKIARALTGAQGKIEIIYHPFVLNTKNVEKDALEAFNKALESDLRKKATSIGIHREDFSVNLNDKDIATYGSQGENRLVALALKLAPYFLIDDEDKKPIVILDDVMSELDEKHQKLLIKFISKMKQVFITATKLEISGASQYSIKKKQETEVF